MQKYTIYDVRGASLAVTYDLLSRYPTPYAARVSRRSSHHSPATGSTSGMKR